jgi:co-chaperonin GroES (HSP10)
MSEKKTDYKTNNKLRCVGDRIIVKPISINLKTELVMDWNKMSEADQWAFALEHPYQGEVVMVGDGKRFDGLGFDVPDCKPGDIVLYYRNAGVPLKFNFGEGMQDYMVIRESNIHLVIRK